MSAAPLFYTVVLRLPDYVAPQYGDCVALDVRARGPRDAVRRAQIETCKSWEEKPDKYIDFVAVALFEGAHENILHEVQR